MSQTETQTAERTTPRNGGGVAFGMGALANSESNGQLVATGALTDKQEAFTEHYVQNGGIGTEAAKAAGYGGRHAVVACELLKIPKVRARIQELVQIKLETKGAVVGYGVLMEIAQDPGAPPGVRRHCARDLLELAGFYKDKGADPRNPMKSLSEMTREELDEVVKQGAAVLQAASKVDRTIEGRVAPHNAQVVELPALSD